MSERPLFKQCPGCQQFSPEENNFCVQCGYDFPSDDKPEDSREAGDKEKLSPQPPGNSEAKTPKKKRGCLRKLGLGVLFVVGLLIVLTFIGSLLPDDIDDSTASERSINTPIPTLTSAPLETNATQSTDKSDTQPTARPSEPQDSTSRAPSSSATPTIEEALLDFILCDRLKANLLMRWGQVPDLIYSDDPRVSGDIEPGDYVMFLMPEPDVNGNIWIEVFPHDGRAVGNTSNMVWIDWDGLIQFRLDQEMFTCEDDWTSAARETKPSASERATATPASRPMATINSDINVREGPGTEFDAIGTASAGQQFLITGKNAEGDWWQIIDGGGRIGWVYGPLVTTVNVANVQVASPTNVNQKPNQNRTQVDPGIHRVGIEIQAGIYVGQTGTGFWDSCYWARLSNLTGTDNILANDNAQGLYYVEVLTTDRAFETECALNPIENISARSGFLTIIPTGTYLVGRDIGPGLYRGQAGTELLESCYWARLSNVSGSDDILANDNAQGTYFVEVLPNDFALQSECQIEKVE